MNLYITNRPNREPDFKMRWLSFWWEEKIQESALTYYHFNPDNWTWNAECREIWLPYLEFMTIEDLDKVKSAYASWLLEKELGF